MPLSICKLPDLAVLVWPVSYGGKRGSKAKIPNRFERSRLPLCSDATADSTCGSLACGPMARSKSETAADRELLGRARSLVPLVVL